MASLQPKRARSGRWVDRPVGHNLKIFDTAKPLATVFEEGTIRIVHLHDYKAAILCPLARRHYPFAIVKTEHGLPEPMAGTPTRDWRDHFTRPGELRADRFKALIVGRLDLLNGHQVAIAALQDRGMPSDVHLCMVGDGPRRDELQELAAPHGVAERVALGGPIVASRVGGRRRSAGAGADAILVEPRPAELARAMTERYLGIYGEARK